MSKIPDIDITMLRQHKQYKNFDTNTASDKTKPILVGTQHRLDQAKAEGITGHVINLE